MVSLNIYKSSVYAISLFFFLQSRLLAAWLAFLFIIPFLLAYFPFGRDKEDEEVERQAKNGIAK